MYTAAPMVFMAYPAGSHNFGSCWKELNSYGKGEYTITPYDQPLVRAP
jgi:hypothetical protein